MKSLIIAFLFLIPSLGFAQDNICETINFNSFEIVKGQEDHLALMVSIKDEKNPMITYPGFMLLNETGDTVAYTTRELATYALVSGAVYKLKIVKELTPDFSGKIEIYRGYLGHKLVHKVCTKSIEWTNKINDSTVNVDNLVYLEYKENETKGAGRIKKINATEWYEYGHESSEIISIYKETHRDENYIYLISKDAIFQFDVSRNKIMKNGIDVLEILRGSNKDIEIK